MPLERALDRRAVGVGVDAQSVSDVDPLDHEHAVVELDLAFRLARQPSSARIDVTRLQRAPEGAGQSASGSGDDVVERRRPLRLAATRDAVMVCDLVMDPEPHRLVGAGKLGAS